MTRSTLVRIVAPLLVAALGLACDSDKPADKPDKPLPTREAQAGADKTPPPMADGGGAPGDEVEAEDEDDYAGYDPKVVQAARIAKEIEADPTKADAVLEAANLDREGLDVLMGEIGEDPELATQYRVARGL
jgi:hypothetical protein